MSKLTYNLSFLEVILLSVLKEKVVIYLEVGCAIITHNGKILISQRKPNVSMGGYWEFAGGKREPGETIENCLVREAFEELGIVITPERFWKKKKVVHKDREIELFFYWCAWKGGKPEAKDCQDWAWVLPEELKNYHFLPADLEIIHEIASNPLPF